MDLLKGSYIILIDTILLLWAVSIFPELQKDYSYNQDWWDELLWMSVIIIAIMGFTIFSLRRSNKYL